MKLHNQLIPEYENLDGLFVRIGKNLEFPKEFYFEVDFHYYSFRWLEGKKLHRLTGPAQVIFRDREAETSFFIDGFHHSLEEFLADERVNQSKTLINLAKGFDWLLDLVPTEGKNDL